MNKRINIVLRNRKQSLVCFYLLHLYGCKSNPHTEESISIEAVWVVGFRNVIPQIKYSILSKETDIQSIVISKLAMIDGNLPITSSNGQITSGIVLFTSSNLLFTSGIILFTSSIILFTSGIVLFTSSNLPFTSSNLPFTSSNLPFTSSIVLFTSGIILFTSSNLLFTSGILPFTYSIDPITSGIDRVLSVSKKTVCSILILEVLPSIQCFKFKMNILYISKHKY